MGLTCTDNISNSFIIFEFVCQILNQDKLQFDFIKHVKYVTFGIPAGHLRLKMFSQDSFYIAPILENGDQFTYQVCSWIFTTLFICSLTL